MKRMFESPQFRRSQSTTRTLRRREAVSQKEGPSPTYTKGTPANSHDRYFSTQPDTEPAVDTKMTTL